MPLRHTPYDGSHTPFTIGLGPLDLNTWLEPDEHLHSHLAEKSRLLIERYEDVIAVEPGTEAAQREVLDLILAHLQNRFPERYRIESTTVTVLPDGPTYDLEKWNGPWLELAARLVQEDLCIMRGDTSGHRLAAAVVCFPSSWSLKEKFSQPLHEIHGPVPGIDERMSSGIERVFSHLKAERPVWRLNWAISGDPNLHHPVRHSGERPVLDRDRDIGEQLYLRIERQTLRRLPISGDILFTIRIHIDRMSELRSHPEGPALAAGLRAQMLALEDAQLDYKGLLEVREPLAAYLASVATRTGHAAQ